MIKGYLFYVQNVFSIIGGKNFKGWGRKQTGRFALWCHHHFDGNLSLLEDGFIRSVGIKGELSSAFSVVRDNIGIYYDAISPSELESILDAYDFYSDSKLIAVAKEAINLIKTAYISKYNNAPLVDDKFCNKYGLTVGVESKGNVLIIAQTAGDASLEYGLAGNFSTAKMIQDAINENPNAAIYIKIHPDVFCGKKESDISLEEIPNNCTIIDEDINPISLLKHFDKVYTKTSGMGMEALILGKEVVCYGMPYYAGWGLTVDKQVCNRRTRKLKMEELFAGAYILYTIYCNPYSQKKSDILDTIKTIVKYRDIYRQNEGKLYFFGFSGWKRKFTSYFFPTFQNNEIVFCSTFNDGVKKGLIDASSIYIWGKKSFDEVEAYANEKNIAIRRVEDGFIRSVSLGSDLTKAYSLVVDSSGIYYDPTEPSDLERLLNSYVFDDDLLERAKKLQSYLIEHKISKYNLYQDKKLELKGLNLGQTVVMVPGQVEDDASIVYGANGMTNLELLQQARENKPDAYIIYKPHPDVLAGNRQGSIETKMALMYCDVIIKQASLDSVLDLADEVHTMTSLVGMEALIRGKKVYTYGLPFYAGWGLTIDNETCLRRTVTRTLDELVAVAFILYPRYINPKTNKLCEIEVLLHEIDKQKKRYNNNIVFRVFIDVRNLISRKVQLIIKTVFGE